MFKIIISALKIFAIKETAIILIIVTLHLVMFTFFHYITYCFDSTGNAYSLTSEIAKRAQIDASVVDINNLIYLKKCQDILAYIISSYLPSSLNIKGDSTTMSTSYNRKYDEFELIFNSTIYYELDTDPMPSSTITLPQSIPNLPQYVNTLSVKYEEIKFKFEIPKTPRLVTNLREFIEKTAIQYSTKVEILQSSIKNRIIEKETFSFWDFLYFTVVTSTTVGFGDISPVSWFAQLITMINSISGLIMFAFVGSFIYRLLSP